MRKTLMAAAAALIGSVGVASAADLGGYAGSYKDEPVYAPGFSWTGFYIGGHVGGAWGDLTVFDVDSYAGGTPLSLDTDVDVDGVFGGATVGYNVQRGRFVFGIEADIGVMDLGNNGLLTETNSNTRVGIDSGLYGDVTGRIGVTTGRALFYAKGGFAFLHADADFSSDTGDEVTSDLDTFMGWTVGGGVEYALGSNWTLKAEYQYFDFGDQSYTVDGDNSFDNELTVHTAKVGLNYKFGSHDEPLK